MSRPAVALAPGLEAVYQRLRTAIIDGRLRPDERLTEPALADLLDVSRTPVREALRLLLAEGLVQRQVPGGLRVAPLRREDADRIFDLRARLEGLLARDACLRLDDAGEARLRRLVTLMEHLAEDELEVLRLGREFHETIAEIADHPWCSQLLRGIRGHVDRYRTWATSAPGRPGQAVAEHRTILDALAARDPEAAERMMQEHVIRSADAVRRALPGSDGGPTANSGRGRVVPSAGASTKGQP